MLDEQVKCTLLHFLLSTLSCVALAPFVQNNMSVQSRDCSEFDYEISICTASLDNLRRLGTDIFDCLGQFGTVY